ncbi:MAG: hypothetical protein AAFP89_26430 [Bacteroidota bacterium]
MKTKTYWFCILLWIGTLSICPAQEDLGLPDITPPSPTAAALGKYGEIPVSHFTGIPNVSIPLGGLAERGIEIPISLSYHAGGYRVEEKASWVGLGWSLNAGGVITRTKMGKADDVPPLGYWYQDAVVPDPDNPQDVWDINLQRKHLIAQGDLDIQPDVYSYNFLGYTGKFVIPPGETLAVTIPYSDVKIEMIPGYQGTLGKDFKITTPEGIVCVFASRETTRTAAESGTSGNVNLDAYTSSWYLTEIQHLNAGQTIQFEYDTYNIEYDEGFSESEGHFGDYNPGACPGGTASCQAPDLTYSFRYSSVTALHLKRIIGTQEQIDFTSVVGQRSDIPGMPQLTDVSFQRNGQVYNRFRFVYGTFGVNNNQYFSPALPLATVPGGRLKLLEVRELGEIGNTEPYKSHTFSYEGTPLPQPYSYSVDHWGFYNGKANTSYLPALTIPVNDIPPVAQSYLPPDNCDELSIVGANREPDFAYTKAGILEQITYPTQGKVQLAYELNDRAPTANDPTHEELNQRQSVDFIKLSSGSTVEFGYSDSFDIPYEQEVTIRYTIKNDLLNLGETGGGTFFLQQLIPFKGTTQKVILQTWTDPSDQFCWNLAPGTYQLGASGVIRGDDVEGHIDYHIQGNAITYHPVGGLRIKEVTVQPLTGPSMKKAYTYTSSNFTDVSSGIVNFKPSYYYSAFNVKSFQPNPGSSNGMSCVSLCGFISRTSSSNVSLNFSNGSHICYPVVIEKNTGGSQNGEIEYHYSFTPDDLSPVFPFPPPTSHAFERGLLEKKLIRDAAGNLVREEIMEYDITSAVQSVAGGTIAFVMDFSKLPNVWYDSTTSEFTNLYEYNHLSAKVLPTKKTIKDYSMGSGQAIVTEEETFYDNPAHTYPTRVEITDSEGGKQKRVMRYPLDYASNVTFPDGNGLIIQDLIDRHMIGIPLETQSWKVNAGGQEELLSVQVTRMKDYANASVVSDQVIQPHAYLLMETVDPLTTATFSEPTDGHGRYTQLGGIGANLVRRLSYDFTPSGTMKAKIPENGTRISYLWDEGENQLLGQVLHASENQVAYSSFESPQNGSVTGTDITLDGGWEIVRTVAAGWVGADPTQIQTGRYGFHLANRGTGSNERYIRKTGIPAGEYIVSFWHKGDPVSIVGSNSQATPSHPGSEMQYVELQVNIGSGGALEVSSSLNAYIDELRLYPVGAQMTTYCYDDKLRLHTQTDVNNRSTYYHYDAYGRLQYVQDQEGHYVQGYEYNYKN